jgi:hypothetical protein
MNFNNLLESVWDKYHWHNTSTFCNKKTHAFYAHFRPYRRGNNRCLICGAKLGKIHCERWKNKDRMLDHIFEGYPMLDMLRQKGLLK